MRKAFGRGATAAAGHFFAVALSLLGDQMLYAVLPAVHEAVGVPVTAVGLLLSANRLIRLLTNSLAGYVIERFGRHWPFVLALLLGGITTVAYGVVYGVWAFLVHGSCGALPGRLSVSKG